MVRQPRESGLAGKIGDFIEASTAGEVQQAAGRRGDTPEIARGSIAVR